MASYIPVRGIGLAGIDHQRLVMYAALFDNFCQCKFYAQPYAIGAVRGHGFDHVRDADNLRFQ